MSLLSEQFRPEIPEGVRGWGAKGELDLGRMRKLSMNRRVIESQPALGKRR